MNDTTDRRVRRTRELLHRALIGLMIERDYDRITVQDVLDRADIGRSTFYAHYRNKDDLLLASSTAFLREAVATTHPRSADSPLLAPVYTLLSLAHQNPDIYRALTGPKAGTVVLRATRRIGAEILADDLTGRLDMDDDELADTVTFLSWALFGLLSNMVADGSRASPADVFLRFRRLAVEGLGGRLRTGRSGGAA